MLFRLTNIRYQNYLQNRFPSQLKRWLKLLKTGRKLRLASNKSSRPAVRSYFVSLKAAFHNRISFSESYTKTVYYAHKKCPDWIMWWKKEQLKCLKRLIYAENVLKMGRKWNEKCINKGIRGIWICDSSLEFSLNISELRRLFNCQLFLDDTHHELTSIQDIEYILYRYLGEFWASEKYTTLFHLEQHLKIPNFNWNWLR